MTAKLINLTKEDDGQCLLCCNKQATIKMGIRRSKYNDNVISFHVCDECLAQMQKDIEVCE